MKSIKRVRAKDEKQSRLITNRTSNPSLKNTRIVFEKSTPEYKEEQDKQRSLQNKDESQHYENSLHGSQIEMMRQLE